jgi:hypothetical protein
MAMNKLLFAAAGLAAVAGLAVLLPVEVGHAQTPVGKGESITVPVAPSGGQPVQQGSAQALFQGQPTGSSELPTSPNMPGVQPIRPVRDENQPHSLREYLSQSTEDVAINNDIAVQPSCGQYMVCISWYSGPDAPKSARALALELRGPDYGLHAYVFTKGMEEREAALQKIREDFENQKKKLDELKLDCEPHIRVPLIRYEIQCAVLVGGYKDIESAHRDLEKLRTLSPEKLRLKNIPLHSVMSDVKLDKDDKPCYGKVGLVNPFTHALVVANPSVKLAERPKGMTEEDLVFLRTLNENEPYSLFKCPNKYTLVVRKFTMPAAIDSKQSSSSMLNIIGLGSIGAKVDTAAESAHNLAKVLNGNRIIGQQQNLKAWVLHTKYCSYVSVGSFDDSNDPQIRFFQEELPKMNSNLHASIQLVAHPPLMPVPH